MKGFVICGDFFKMSVLSLFFEYKSAFLILYVDDIIEWNGWTNFANFIFVCYILVRGWFLG